MQLIGQKENLDIIEKWENMPTFTIIQGDEHMGKTYLILYLCKKFNLNYYKMESNSVDTVRDLIKIMKNGSNMVYHFDNFDTASIQAKNSLLKITEEPKPGNYIVISGGPQIKTLESRAKKILMNPYTTDEVMEYMKLYYPDDSLREFLLYCGINSPAKIEHYKLYEKIETLGKYAEDIVSKITYLSIDHILQITSRFENRYDEVDAYLLFLYMLINIIENKVKNPGYYSYRQYLEILIKGKNSLIRQPTLKRKMLIWDMFYQIYLCNKVK